MSDELKPCIKCGDKDWMAGPECKVCGRKGSANEVLTSHKLADSEPDIEALYYELLYAVASAYPDESRHETALRYIQQAETHGQVPTQEAVGDERH